MEQIVDENRCINDSTTMYHPYSQNSQVPKLIVKELKLRSERIRDELSHEDTEILVDRRRNLFPQIGPMGMHSKQTCMIR